MESDKRRMDMAPPWRADSIGMYFDGHAVMSAFRVDIAASADGGSDMAALMLRAGALASNGDTTRTISAAPRPP